MNHPTSTVIRVVPAVLFTGVWLLNGCQLAPPPETPPAVQQIGETENYVYQGELGGARPIETTTWWREIGGPGLDAQVNRLLQDSLELREAREQVRQVAERARQTGARRLPAMGAEVDAARSRYADPFGNFRWDNSYAAALSGSFDTDVFGSLRSRHRSAVLLSEAARLNYRALEQQAIAGLARSWVGASILERRLALAEATAASYRTTYQLTDQRYQAGSTRTSATDVMIARQNLESALADIPAIRRQLEAQLIGLDRQLAYLPGTTAQAFAGYVEVSPDLLAPVGLPAALLAARPDVAAAQLSYQAALQDVGAARADMLPGLSLAASLSFQNGELSDLFDADRYLAGLVASLTQPVFQGGRLRSELRLQKSEATELATAYARVALSALADVETALVQQRGLLEELQQLRRALAAAENANEIAQLRYRQGLLPLLSVLEAQRALVGAQQGILSTEQSLLESRINLHLSLGGSWFGDDRAPSDEPPATRNEQETP